MFDVDDKKAIRRTVIGGVIMLIVTAVWGLLPVLASTINAGPDAKRMVQDVSIKHDSLSAQCQKERQTNMIFRITAQKDIETLYKSVEETRQMSKETNQVVKDLYKEKTGRQWVTR